MGWAGQLWMDWLRYFVIEADEFIAEFTVSTVETAMWCMFVRCRWFSRLAICISSSTVLYPWVSREQKSLSNISPSNASMRWNIELDMSKLSRAPVVQDCEARSYISECMFRGSVIQYSKIGLIQMVRHSRSHRWWMFQSCIFQATYNRYTMQISEFLYLKSRKSRS